LLSVPMIRNIVGQVGSKLSLREAMDSGKIVLVNLSKGNLGEDNSAFLGSMLVTKFQLDAMSRTDIPEKERKDFYLYVDEFQNFATESFATILSEARKYRLSLTIATQYLAQMEEATAAAVFGNVGSLLVFQVGADDAETLAEQLGGDVTPRDLLSLPKFTAYVRLLIDGMPSRPFSLETVAPTSLRRDRRRASIIRRVSRHRYGRAAREVEEDIRKGMDFTA
jgi:DNA helicase HerA-like ATPase